MPYRAERADSAAGHSWLVIDTETFEVHAGVREYVLFLRGGSRSPNTIRAYARAIAVFLDLVRADRDGLAHGPAR